MTWLDEGKGVLKKKECKSCNGSKKKVFIRAQQDPEIAIMEADPET